MNSIGELLKIADMLDQSGALQEADEIIDVIKQMAAANVAVEQSNTEECPECDQKEKIAKVISTLIKVADSLDSKGAFKEAQMADDILNSLKQEISLPQAFSPRTDAAPAAITTPISPSAPAATAVVDQPTQQEVSQATETAPTKEVATEKVETGTPFNALPDNKNSATETPKAESPKVLPVESVKQPEASFDELTLDQFKEMIDGLKYRYSQGRQREKYQKVLEVAEKAHEYKKAYEDWLGHAHKLFEDEPIRLKI